MAAAETVTAKKYAAPYYVRRFAKVLNEMWRDRVLYLWLAPFLLSFLVFIVLPVFLSALLSVTAFDGFSFPRFVGLHNFIVLFTQDLVFYQYALPNTFWFALIVGPGGYALNFFIALLISRVAKRAQDYYTLAYYGTSLAGGVALSVVWQAVFNGDRGGYLNSFLLRLGVIETPQLWLEDVRYLLPVMMIVTLMTGFGVGFLAMLAGIVSVNRELYEAGKIDGIRSPLQEVYYITIPSMKPQMLFSAVMAIVGTLKAGAIGAQLTGSIITPQYAGHLILNHIDDYAFLRYELGYASAVAVVLLLIMYFAMRFAYRLFAPKEGDE